MNTVFPLFCRPVLWHTIFHSTFTLALCYIKSIDHGTIHCALTCQWKHIHAAGTLLIFVIVSFLWHTENHYYTRNLIAIVVSQTHKEKSPFLTHSRNKKSHKLKIPDVFVQRSQTGEKVISSVYSERA